MFALICAICYSAIRYHRVTSKQSQNRTQSHHYRLPRPWAAEKAVKKQGKKTSSKLAAKLPLEINRPVSARTTQRRLEAAGLKGCKARKKPWFSDTNKKARYEWALKYRSFKAEDWLNVVWSDESNFEVSQASTCRNKI